MIGDVGAGGRPSLTGGDPFGVAAFGARILLRRWMRGDLRLLRRIEQLRILPVDPRNHFTGIGDPELPAGIERPGERVGDLLEAWRVEMAVAPHYGDCGPAASGGAAAGDASPG